MPDTEDATLIPTTQVRQRYGGVSDMWIERRLLNDPSFPKPIYIGKRRYWSLRELEAWERALPRAIATGERRDALVPGETIVVNGLRPGTASVK